MTLLLTPILALTFAPVPPQDSVEQTTAVVVLARETRLVVKGASVHDGRLRIPAARIESITGFVRKPEGLCSGELCISSDKSWFGGKGDTAWFDLTRFAEAADMALAADEDQRVWSLSPSRIVANGLAAGRAPEFALPGLQGKVVRLSDFRGKKVLLLTWASW